jgi:hypothetical protein
MGVYTPPQVVTPTPGGAPGDGLMNGALTVQANKSGAGLNSQNLLTVGPNNLQYLALDANGNFEINFTPVGLTVVGGFEVYLGSGPGAGTYLRGPIVAMNNVATKGLGAPSIYGLDGPRSTSAPDGAAFALYTLPVGGPYVVDATAVIDCTAYTSGSGTYTVAWTKPDGQIASIVATAGALNAQQAVSAPGILCKGGTSVTVQLTGTFVATFTVAATMRQVA